MMPASELPYGASYLQPRVRTGAPAGAPSGSPDVGDVPAGGSLGPVVEFTTGSGDVILTANVLATDAGYLLRVDDRASERIVVETERDRQARLTAMMEIDDFVRALDDEFSDSILLREGDRAGFDLGDYELFDTPEKAQHRLVFVFDCLGSDPYQDPDVIPTDWSLHTYARPAPTGSGSPDWEPVAAASGKLTDTASLFPQLRSWAQARDAERRAREDAVGVARLIDDDPWEAAPTPASPAAAPPHRLSL